MKIKISLIITVLSLLHLYCSDIQISRNSVLKELNLTADSIKKDKRYIYKLDNKTVGKNGYFYIIRTDAKISYHPSKALLNYDFSRDPFVQRILKERNGCLSFNANGVHRYIFFTEIDSSEILCLTIGSLEFTGPVYECNKNVEESE